MRIRLTAKSASTAVLLLSLLPLTNLAAQTATPLARTSDNQPKVEGFWEAVIGGTYSLTNPRRGGGRLDELIALRKGLTPKIRPSRVADPRDGVVPYLPWARAKQQDIEAHADVVTEQTYVDPQARCLPDGPIRATFWSPFAIQQYPGYLVFVYEQNHPYRIIPLDGRPHVSQNIRLWMGDSRGHWEGNTLVVDVANNNSKSRLSNEGDFASDGVHIVEKYTFHDDRAMTYEATLTDSAVYTRPWTIRAEMKRAHSREPNYELWEDACHEGERSVDQILVSASAGPQK